MKAWILMIPLFLLRFGLIGVFSKEALKRAAHFAPIEEKEKIIMVLYQLSNIFIIIYPLFLKIKREAPLFFVALAVYALGILVLAFSAVSFAKQNESGINTKGIYSISRNPMYMGYFIYFFGCALMTRSIILFIVLIIFQLSSHKIILSEERWCISHFGEEYIQYMGKVRRYL